MTNLSNEDVVGSGKHVDEVAKLTINEPAAIMEALALNQLTYELHRLDECEVE